MKNPKKGAIRRLAFGGLIIIFVFVMAVLAASSFGKGNSEPAQVSKGVTDPHDTGGEDRTGPCTPLGGTKCGKVVIRKDANPDSYQDFYFVHTIPGYVSPFMLDDDGTLSGASTILSYVRTFYTPENGLFSVSEQMIPQVYNPDTNQYEGGYNVSISCIDPSGGTTTVAATANISMFNAETVTCTFKNTPMAPTQGCSPHDTWTQKASFGGVARQGAIGFSIGNKGYIGMGNDSSGTTIYQDFWEYTPGPGVMGGTWTQKANFGGGPRVNAIGFSITDMGYVGTGSSTGYNTTQDFWQYNPSTNSWTQKADMGVSGRSGATGFSIDLKGYVGLGNITGGGAYQDFWEYTPGPGVMGGTWTQKANFGGGPRVYAAGFSVAGKGYIGTGQYAGSNQDFWEYTPGPGVMGGTWTQKANFGGGPRTLAVGFAIGTKGYIGTGGWPLSQNFWEYTPGPGVMGGTWTQKANFGGGLRNLAIGFSLGNKGYIGTGYGQPYWNPITNSWDSVYKDFYEYCP